MCVMHECVLSVEQTFVNEICLIGSVCVCVCVHDMEEMDMKQYGVFGEDMESITSAAGVADKE